MEQPNHEGSQLLAGEGLEPGQEDGEHQVEERESGHCPGHIGKGMESVSELKPGVGHGHGEDQLDHGEPDI